MPLRDQDGRETEEVEVRFPSGLSVTRAVVRHDEVLLYIVGLPEPALSISRPTHPGAGLAFDISDVVEYER